MYVFDIYHHPRYGTEAVRRGFSWSAFLLPSVWAVRRGMGFTTWMLVVATTLVFDLTELATAWVPNAGGQILVLLTLVALVGWRPGFTGWIWHARALEGEQFRFQCTVAANSRRQAIRAAANDDYFNGPIRMAAA